MEENVCTYDNQTADGASTYAAPQNATEESLAALWAELLDLPKVGVNDNFLLLGGESLVATQAASRIRNLFGCEISIRSIFVGTVADVAAEVIEARGA
jgi:hypothetical protein